jgi:hypothetical protein
MNEQKLDEFLKKQPAMDQADWLRYQMSLSTAERRMKAEALLNFRITLRSIETEVGCGDRDGLTESEKSSYIRMMFNQLSQIEHWTFESWREARRLRVATTINITVNVCLGILLLLALIASSYQL